MGELGPIGRHGIRALHNPQRDHIVIGALVAEHANRLDRKKHAERLPHFPIITRRHHLLLEHEVGVAQDLEFVGRDVTHHAHAETGTGERLAPDDFLR